MRLKRGSVAVVVFLLGLSAVALADKIITKNGEIWEGLVIRETDDQVIIDVKGVCQMPIKKADIAKWIKAKKSVIKLKTGEKYEYFKLVRETDKEIVIKLDGVDDEMTIKKSELDVKNTYIGPDAKEKDDKKKATPKRKSKRRR